MKINKLLFVTEFEELWFDALQSLMDLRKIGLNHFVFLHVIDRDEVAMRRGVGYLKSEEVKLKEIANVRFIDWAETLFEQGMEVGAHIVVGSIVPKVVSIADDEDIDLIVTGYHKKGKIKELYEGSEIMEIIKRTSKPVMVHKYMLETGKTNDNPFEKPLLAMDWSPASHKAAEFLLDLGEIIKKVQVIHVATEKEIEGTTAMDVQKTRKINKKKLDEVTEMFTSRGIEAENHLYVGDAVQQLEKAAQERNASMIVGGTTGKESIKDRLLGSVPKALSEQSLLPTLFVPPKK